MPTIISENKFVCFNKAKTEVIPFWVKSLDINEQNSTIIARFNSLEFFDCLSERISDNEEISQTDTAKPETYSVVCDSELGIITFTGNLLDALSFIRFHRAISDDTCKRSITYIKNHSLEEKDNSDYKQHNPNTNLSNTPLKVEKVEEKEAAEHKLGCSIGLSFDALTNLFGSSNKAPAVCNKNNSTTQKPSTKFNSF